MKCDAAHDLHTHLLLSNSTRSPRQVQLTLPCGVRRQRSPQPPFTCRHGDRSPSITNKDKESIFTLFSCCYPYRKLSHIHREDEAGFKKNEFTNTKKKKHDEKINVLKHAAPAATYLSWSGLEARPVVPNLYWLVTPF